MAHDKRAKFNTQISEEAAEWFVEFRLGDIDAESRRAFDAWVRTSPEHLRAYLEVAAVWNEGGSLDAERSLDVGTLMALAHTDQNVVSLDVGSSERVLLTQSAEAAPARGIWRRPFAAAASVAAIVIAAAVFVLFQLYGAPTYATAVGEQRSIRLADGSTVELNSRSRLRVKFTDAERMVELLEGQALFQVAKNPARPFIVRAGNAHVRAVGTQFDVNRRRNDTVVTVIEGRVAVLTADDAYSGEVGTIRGPDDRNTPSGSKHTSNPGSAGGVFLAAGEQLRVTTQPPAAPTRVNVVAATAWTQRQLVLESALLRDVAEEFNRYSTRKLVIEDSASKELRLSGVFATDPEFLIRYLRERNDVTVVETQSEIRIIHHD